MFVSCRKNFTKRALGFVSFQAIRTFSSQPLYVQGQKLGAKTREYFYYIDHDGMVWIICIFLDKYFHIGFINKIIVFIALFR